VRVLIADDEPPARAKLRRLFGLEHERARFELIGEARDGAEALHAMRQHQPELLCVDVQMPGMDGFELLQALGPARSSAVIFSTAHEMHALRAFEAHAVDYLLKPYTAQRFRIALDKALWQLEGSRTLSPPAAAKLTLRTETGWLALDPASIVRISAAGKHVLVVSEHGSHRVRNSLAGLVAKLSQAQFVRVHRGEIVRLDAVQHYEPSARGDGILTLANGDAVVLSRTQRAEFVRRFQRLDVYPCR
jgi:two-component system, LytTR family, response regulator